VLPIASAFVFLLRPQAKTGRGSDRKLSAQVFTQFSPGRHLVVTVCCFDLKHEPHRFRSKAVKGFRTLSLLISAVLCTSAYATPKVVIISLDGATPRIVDQLNANGRLNPNEGVNLLRAKGF
jgi:hypothetical protein